MYNNPFMFSQQFPNFYRGLSPNLMINPSTLANKSLFSKLGSSISLFKNLNWSNLINNTSKTIGIINQTIPIIKQAGPMFRNMKSVLKVASLFKDETDQTKKTNTSFTEEKKDIIIKNDIPTPNEIKENTTNNNNSPTFFIN